MMKNLIAISLALSAVSAQADVTNTNDAAIDKAEHQLSAVTIIGSEAVSYTHLTLPTNREV